MQTIEANLVDLKQDKIYPVRLEYDKIIHSITPINKQVEGYLLPGFVDAHVHIESSLLIPSEFARMAVLHGTVATISDPHEIANVLGIQGVQFMVENGKQTPFKFFFGAPSCVPATVFETAGDAINSDNIAKLLQQDDIYYLAEMMNFPGVLYDDEEVCKKIAHAHRLKKPIDGHAPGLVGEKLRKYFSAGITTDHECFSLAEALEKLQLGMHVLIREGSAARNFNELIPAIKAYPKQIMFCSDDKHPDSLLLGHINQLCARAVKAGYNLFDVLRAACINPVKHYNVPVGQLKIGDSADFIVAKDLSEFAINKTVIAGEAVAQQGKSFIPSVNVTPINKFTLSALTPDDFAYQPQAIEPTIVCYDGQLITGKEMIEASNLLPENNVLKIVVVNRYKKQKIAAAYIKNFGLQKGAIASSVAHDSHNIVCVGVSDEAICNAVNLVIAHAGGLSAVSENEAHILPLPVAGLMSTDDAWKVAENYIALDKFSKVELGSTLQAPFMSLSFMALLVIPSLKLSDKGLFDADSFKFLREV